MNPLGVITPFPPISLMIWYPRNLNPSVIGVMFVFSSDNVSPLVLRNALSSSFMARASAFVP